MVGGFTTGLYPNLIQNAFFSSSVLLVQSVFGDLPRTNSSQVMGQAKALEPEAWVKQSFWSHSPGSSKGPGTMSLGQAKSLELFAWGKQRLKEPRALATQKLKGQKAGKELRTPESNLSHSNALQSLRCRPYTPCHPQSFFS